MALKKCRECGGDVSTKAASCPKCGAKLKGSGIGCLIVIIIVIILLMPVVVVVG